MNHPQTPLTLEQLAQLYQARNTANSALSRALRSKDKARIEQAKAVARQLNTAYDAQLRRYKRQQKSARRATLRTSMIRFYLDAKTANPSPQQA